MSQPPESTEKRQISMLASPEKRLAVQAYEQVLDMIMSYQIRPGSLVQERKLAAEMEMSRTPLRDGLRLLEAEGLLVRRSTGGLEVRTMNVEDYVENLGVRRMLEPEAARTAAGRIPQETLDDITRRLEGLLEKRSRAEKVSREEVRYVDEQLHDAVASASGNRQLATIIRRLRRQTQIFDLRSLPDRYEETCREHLAIVRALAAGNGDEAADAMRNHLDQVRQCIIAWLTRL